MVCCREGKVPGGLLHLVWLPDSQNVVPFTDPISTVLLLTPPHQMYPTMPVVDSRLSRPLLTTLIPSWHSNSLCSPYKPSSSKCLSNNSSQCSLLNWFWLRCQRSLHFHYTGPSLFWGFFFFRQVNVQCIMAGCVISEAIQSRNLLFTLLFPFISCFDVVGSFFF